MESNTNRNIKDGSEYDHLFPRAKLTERTVKRGANVEDTVKFIPQVVKQTKWQTDSLTKILKGKSTYESCKNIWDFVYKHIRYFKDDEGLEQIRSPARAWHDRFRGVDCDCYTVFISSILSNLKIPHTLRITRYKKNYFQHIYPIVPTGNGNYITIDCVVEKFNYEEPYNQKEDTNMDLQFLDGIDEPQKSNLDSENLSDNDGIGALFKKKVASNPTTAPAKKGIIKQLFKPRPPAVNPNQGKGKLKQAISKVLHVTNRVNPATVVLRNGVLASMKLNVLKIAQRLKWAYLSDAEAQKRGIDMGKFARLKQAKEKLEKIFYGAGGKPENLKSSILTGKGNANKEVSGLGYMPEGDVFVLNEKMPLPQLIGKEIYESENVNGMEGFDGVGELGVVTAAAVGSASTVMAAIAGLLKSIGNIFPSKDKAAADFTEPDVSKENAEVSLSPASTPAPPSTASLPTGNDNTSSVEEESNESGGSPAKNEENADASKDDKKKDGFWEKNKKWLKPTLWTAGGFGVLYLGYKLVTKDHINGYPFKMKGDKKPLEGLQSKKKPKKEKNQKRPITLM